MQHVSIPKQIKKRQSHACDACRKSKKRCDGKSPCFLCFKRSNICIYSGDKRSKRKSIQTTKQNILQLYQIDGILGVKALYKTYVDNYFYSLNPIQIFNKNVSIDKYLSKPTNKSVLLQYNAILASATRYFCSNPDVYLSFEGNAKQLAGELLDDFSIDTAFGFELLTYHFWGEDITKMNHYRDIGISLCKRILQIGCNPSEYDDIMRIHIGITTMLDINQNTEELGKALDKYSPLLKKISNDTVNNNPNLISNQLSLLSIDELLMLATAHRRLSQLLFNNEGDILHEDPTKNPFKELTQSEVEEAKTIVSNTHKIVTKYFPPTIVSIAKNSTMLLNAFLLYAMNDKMSAISLLETVVTSSESASYLLCACTYFITYYHFAFRIAFLEKQYTLANRISGLQRKLAEVMPVAKQVMEIDMSLLRSIANSPLFSYHFHQYIPAIETQNKSSLWNNDINDINNCENDIFQFNNSNPSLTFISNQTDNDNINTQDNNTLNYSQTSNLFNNILIQNTNDNIQPQLNTTQINNSNLFNFDTQITNDTPHPDILNIEELNPSFLDNLITEFE